jgi:hypothetical protein
VIGSAITEVVVVAELFRFASIRAPKLREAEGADVIALYRPNETTPFRDDVSRLANDGAPRGSFVERAQRYVVTGAAKNVVDADYPPIALRGEAAKRKSESFADLRTFVQRMLARSPAEAVASPEHANARMAVADAILALSLSHDAADRGASGKRVGLRRGRVSALRLRDSATVGACATPTCTVSSWDLRSRGPSSASSSM